MVSVSLNGVNFMTAESLQQFVHGAAAVGGGVGGVGKGGAERGGAGGGAGKASGSSDIETWRRLSSARVQTRFNRRRSSQVVSFRSATRKQSYALTSATLRGDEALTALCAGSDTGQLFK